MSITWNLTSFDSMTLGGSTVHLGAAGLGSTLTGAAIAFERVGNQTIQTYRRTDVSAAYRVTYNGAVRSNSVDQWMSVGVRLHTNGVIDSGNPLIKYIYRDTAFGTWRYGTLNILVGNTTAWRSCYIELTYNPITKHNVIYIDGVARATIVTDIAGAILIGNSIFTNANANGGWVPGANDAAGTYAIKNTTHKIGFSDGYQATAPMDSRSQVIMLGGVRVRQKRMRLVSHDPSWTNDTDIDTHLDKTRPGDNTNQPNPTPVTVRVGGGSGVFMPDLTDSNDQIIAGHFVLGHARQTGQSGQLRMDFTNLPDADDLTGVVNATDTVTVGMRARVFGTNGTLLSKAQVENTRVIITPVPV